MAVVHADDGGKLSIDELLLRSVRPAPPLSLGNPLAPCLRSWPSRCSCVVAAAATAAEPFAPAGMAGAGASTAASTSRFPLPGLLLLSAFVLHIAPLGARRDLDFALSLSGLELPQAHCHVFVKRHGNTP